MARGKQSVVGVFLSSLALTLLMAGCGSSPIPAVPARFIPNHTGSELSFRPLAEGRAIGKQNARFTFGATIPLLPPTPLEQATDTWLRLKVLQQYQASLKEFRSAPAHWSAAMEDANELPFMREIRWQVTYADAECLSLHGRDEVFTGGAHGVVNAATANFVWSNRRMRPLRLADLFKCADWREEVVAKVMAELKRLGATQPNHDAVETVLKEERWFMDREGVVFQFQECEVGSHAEGNYQPKLSWKELEPLLREYRPGQLPGLGARIVPRQFDRFLG